MHKSSRVIILWGLIFAKCFTLEYLVQCYAVPINSVLYIWFPSLAMACAATFVFLRLKAEKNADRPKLLRNRLIWGLSGLSMIITSSVIFASNSMNAYLIPAFLAMSLGAAYLAHGMLNKIPLLTRSGIGWWIGSAFLLVQGSVNSLLLFAFLILACSTSTTMVQMRRSQLDLKQLSCH